MGRNDFNLKFFRFRDALTIAGEGRQDDLWLAGSVAYIDFSLDVFIAEYFDIAYYSKGGISMEWLLKSQYTTYEKIKDTAMAIHKKVKEIANRGTTHA